MSDTYTKIQGHHCWWLAKNGKSLANFDSESDVDDIINAHDRSQERIKDLEDQLVGARNKNISCANKVIKLVDRVTDLEVALGKLISVASECDSWESFPSGDIDDAIEALEK